MSKINEIPAFPVDTAHQYPHQEGMTLRDWFAGQALQGILANPESAIMPPEEYAHEAYYQAAAMLAERDRREKEEG